MNAVAAIRRSLPKGHPLPDDVWRSRHRIIEVVLWLHVVGLPIFGMVRGMGLEHSLLEGGFVLVPTVVATMTRSRRIGMLAATFGLLVSSAVLVHLAEGAIEAHFHYFVMLGLVLLYQDWLPFLMYIGFVFFQHWLIGAIDPGSVYNHVPGIQHPLRWAFIHAAFIGGASVIGLVVWRRNEELHERAEASYRELYEGERAVATLKDQLISTVSHEFRTPLTAILGFTSLASSEDTPDEERREYLEVIERRGWQLSRMVEQLLTMAKIESGHLPASFREISVEELVEGLSPMLEGLEVEVRGLEGLRVTSDPDYLHQILSNFLENARKYGAPPYSLEGTRVGPWVEIRLRDRGPGIAEELVPQLFERFVQGTSSAPQREGFGLGLSIVRDMARALQGDAWYEPNQPSGASFGVRLPADPRAAAPSQHETALAT